MEQQWREIPYNYTSLTDKAIFIKYLGKEAWPLFRDLLKQPETQHPARMIYEVLGDMWIIDRNPFIQDDLLASNARWKSLSNALLHRLTQVKSHGATYAMAIEIIRLTEKAITRFENKLFTQKTWRKKLLKALKPHTHAQNICFDGLSRVAHVTDATDWRIAYPLAVLKPDYEEELLGIIQACMTLGVTIIPRGGGTGYTGGAIPIHEETVVINTEKLMKIGEVVERSLPGVDEKVPTIAVQAGAITRRVSEKAASAHCIFAVDPTSQDACTIGGNIAMNAGGKKALRFGTTLDNLVSWRMITPKGQWQTVERIGHNLGKIHTQPQTTFKITCFEDDGKTINGEPRLLTIPGAKLRKQGLGKDVTDKFLCGLPGVQKEGCDGFITSAVFVLYPKPLHTRTFCLEFFGDDLSKAVPAIVEIKKQLDNNPAIALSGLEHLDERYIRAVGYTTKAARQARPKMMLLGDIDGEDEHAVAAAAANVVRLANARDGEGFIAVSPEARRQFWSDRSKTAAIAKHTNAFKINEDVVIPLENLARYSDEIERINIEQSLLNKITVLDALREKINGLESTEDEQRRAKINAAHNLLMDAKKNWQTLLYKLMEPAEAVKQLLPPDIHKAIRKGDSIFRLLQRRLLRISYRDSVATPLTQLFAGDEFVTLREDLLKTHKAIRAKRIIIALHMHAGDGNVHTNIPVHSNDPCMMKTAHHIVERIMNIVHELDGAISGEHGIGLTKFQFLNPTARKAFADYKAHVDPLGHFNRNKLVLGGDLSHAYTPSLRLLQQEALLLEACEFGQINKAIKNCLRCGKCKPVCTTHIPEANLFYAPRDKILATGLILEAFLYEEQTRRGISLRHVEELNDVASHCTLCHKCASPCPVNIDFGDVSMQMRTLLARQGQQKTAFAARLALYFLNTQKSVMIHGLRQILMRTGFTLQKILSKYYQKFSKEKPTDIPKKTTGRPAVKEQVIQFMRYPMPKAVPAKTTRQWLGMSHDSMIPILRNPQKTTTKSEAVFYFPGCGSERLFSQVGLATLAMLYETNTQTILPPGYLCCGYPQRASGQAQQSDAMIIKNRVLFHRMANTLNYLDIKTVIVSCGTCLDQLERYQFHDIFPGCRLLDIHEYLVEKGMSVAGVNGEHYLYHNPCHSPIKTQDPLDVAQQLMNTEVALSKGCCGDAGTLSMARPDIAAQLKHKKQQEITFNINALKSKKPETSQPIKMLTSCPACQKGLSSYAQRTGIETTYLVVELAEKHWGKQWQETFVTQAKIGGVEHILL